MLDVISSLAEVLIDARHKSGKSPAAVADAADVSQRTVERWEKETSFPWKKDLPRAVAAYSKVTEIPELELWERALKRADVRARDAKVARARRTARKAGSQAPSSRRRGS
jgi:transcriptional regulator with XRE-family HTH domain